jgi:chromosome segregation ATPase
MEKTQPASPVFDFEKFWAGLERTSAIVEKITRRQEETAEQMKETDRQMKDTDRRLKETDRLVKENSERLIKESAERQKESAERRKEIEQLIKETDQLIKENAERQKETDRQMKETDAKIGRLGNRFGEMVEYMLMPNLVNKFRELDFVFTKAYPEATIKDEKNQILAEIDITLENGDKVMIVEVKSKPSIDDVRDHVKRMEKVRRHADLHGDKRKFLGSVAGMVLKDNVRDFALNNGFYVIQPSGDTFNIIKPEGKYHPREW